MSSYRPSSLARRSVRLAVHRLRRRWQMAGADRTKRLVDVTGSALALAVLTPLLALIALAVRGEDRGPVLFSQVRVGRHGRTFRMLKFRSMRIDAEQRLAALLAQNQHTGGVTFKMRDDPRITRVGRWLRKFSCDELPQLWNVLRGDMSLVGPRPPVPREVATYSLADRRRLAVTPGLTCLWQVSGRAEIDFAGQVRLDVDYIERRGLAADLVILARTVPAVITGTGAY